MEQQVTSTVDDVGALRTIYREPAQMVIDKVIDHVDDGVRSFIGASPMVILATGDGRRNDASPRGGPAGFVRVLDEHRIAFGDLVGNNRIDSYQNLVANPGIGMLFLVPGVVETLRVNGVATVSHDPALREGCAIDGRVPKVVIVVDVEECYIHCGASFTRGAVWDTNTWLSGDERPVPSAIIREHTGTEATAEQIRTGLQEYYDTAIWHVGGNNDPG